MNLQVMGGLHERLRALGLFRPLRLMDRLFKSDCDFEVWLRPDPIVRIEPIGEAEMLCLKTSNGTIFAEGFAGRTCMPEIPGESSAGGARKGLELALCTGGEKPPELGAS